MKKTLVLIMAVIMLLAVSMTAVAEKPGDTVDAVFTLTANPDKAIALTANLSFNKDVLEIASSKDFQTDGTGGSKMNIDGIAEGETLKATFKIKEGAPAGDYTITCNVVQAGDIDENDVASTVKFSSVKVTVEGAEEPTTEEPTSEEPTTEEPTSEEPTTEESTTEEPTSEEPTSEEPTTEEPTTEEPTTEEPTTEEPTPTPVPATPKPKVNYVHNNIRTAGDKIADLKPELTKKWYTVTAVDLSQDGVQTFDLLSGGYTLIGKLTVTVNGDSVKVDYRYNKEAWDWKDYRFYTIFADADSITGVELGEIENLFEYGTEYSIAKDLNGDTDVLLYILNKATHAK